MKINQISLENFRCYESFTAQLSDVTVVQGHNGAGKSTLAEAVVWSLYGTNILGKLKQDEQLMRQGQSNIAVAVEFTDAEGKTFTISRTRNGKRKSVITMDGRKLNEGRIDSLFGSVNEFLSVFVPGFFSSLEPKDAKAILASCVPPVAKEEVLEQMTTQEAEIIQADKFAAGIDSVDYAMQRVRKEIAEHEEELYRLDGAKRIHLATLDKGSPTPFVSSISTEEMDEYVAAKKLLNDSTGAAAHDRLDALKNRQKELGQAYRALRDSIPKVDTHCHTCGQQLPEEKAMQIRAIVEQKSIGIQNKLKEMLAEGNQVKADIERLVKQLQSSKPDPELVALIGRMEKRLKDEKYLEMAYETNKGMYDQAKSGSQEVEKDIVHEQNLLNQAMTRLRALHSFRFEYVQIQHEKLNQLFEHVHIELLDANKETGEVRETFRIEWKGRPYKLLSKSERVRCDVEIGRVLASARGESMPVYVDDAEGVQMLSEEKFGGQMIAAYVADNAIEIKHGQEELQRALQEALHPRLRRFNVKRLRRGA